MGKKYVFKKTAAIVLSMILSVNLLPSDAGAKALNSLSGQEITVKSKAVADGERGYYYDILTEDEKLVYQAYEELFQNFNPINNTDEFYSVLDKVPDVRNASADTISKAYSDMVKAGRASEKRLKNKYNDDESMNELRYNGFFAYSCEHIRDVKVAMVSDCFELVDNLFILSLTNQNNVSTDMLSQMAADQKNKEDEAVAAIKSDERYDPDDKAEVAYLVHEYVCSHVLYEDDVKDLSIEYSKVHSAYGPLVEGKGLCEGITLMTCLLMNDLGVTCYYLGSFKHAWNMVELDGDLYEMDNTWDLDDGRGVKFNYFNVTTKEMLKRDESGDHDRSYVSERFPEAKGTKYNYAYMWDKNGRKTTPPAPLDRVFPATERLVLDGLVYELDEYGYAICKDYRKKTAEVVIPDYVVYGSYAYVSAYIYEGAFAMNKKLTSLTLPGNVLEIGDKAFFGCEKLKSITIENASRLKSVGEDAFKGIPKKAKFIIKGSAKTFKQAKKKIKAAGAKKAKFIRK